jgi:hypothetical protein
MTREERAYYYASKKNPYKFTIGEIAKHYDDGYQDAVEKAIEHIKNHWNEILVYDYNQFGGCTYNMKKTLDNFRKAMEE